MSKTTANTFRPINIKLGDEKTHGPDMAKTDLAAKIEAALAAVNGKADRHAYTTAREIFELAKQAEEKLDSLGIQKAERPGAVMYSISGGSVPNAYKYVRKATWVKLERRPSGWWIVKIEQAVARKEGGSDSLCLTKAQDEKAVTNFRKQYKLAN